MSILFTLIIVTLLLVFFEVILPGGILGILAFICLLAATWVGFTNYGFLSGLSVFFGTLLLSMVLLFIEFKLLAKTTYGKKFLLSTTIAVRSNQAQSDDSIVGEKGLALTRLNPSGKISRTYSSFRKNGFCRGF